MMMPSKSLDAEADADFDADYFYKLYIQFIHGFNITLEKTNINFI